MSKVLTTDELFKIQMNMLHRIRMLEGTVVKKTDVIRIVENSFDIAKNEIEKSPEERKEEYLKTLKSDFLQTTDFTTEYHTKVSVGFKIVNEFANIIEHESKTKDASYEDVFKPLTDTQMLQRNSALRYIGQGHYRLALICAVDIIKECNFAPNRNECALVKEIVSAFARAEKLNMWEVSDDAGWLAISFPIEIESDEQANSNTQEVEGEYNDI